MTAGDRRQLSIAVRTAIDLAALFGVHSFKAGSRRREIKIAERPGGFAWQCQRCKLAGAYYGEGAALPLARFVAAHTEEVCPC